jgi:signal transduction histidine kinase
MDQSIRKQTNYAPPAFQEAELSRRERLVRSVYRVTYIFITPFLSLLLLVMLPERNLLTTIATVNIAAVLPITFIANKMIDRGKMNAGVLLYILFIFQVLAVNTTIIEGISAVLIPASMVLIVLSGMMLTPHHSYFIAGVAALIYFARHILPPRSFPIFLDQGPLPQIYVTTLTIMAFIFSSVINQISVSDLRKALEDATYKLYQVNHQLERASERKSQFTARTSHELRTPLSSMIAFSDLALRDAYGPINDRLRNALGHVHNGAIHLKGIINDILDLGKIEAGELEIVNTPFKLRDVYSTLEGTIEAAISEKGLDFSLWVSPEMPEDLIGDEGRICQILMNLTSNAVKFTDEGSVQVKLTPYGSESWLIEVADTGPGIPSEEQENVFQAYRQLQRSKGEKKVKGTGHGLAITRNLVELMDGRLEMVSRIGEGTTFRVFFPLVIQEETETLPA